MAISARPEIPAQVARVAVLARLGGLARSARPERVVRLQLAANKLNGIYSAESYSWDK